MGLQLGIPCPRRDGASLTLGPFKNGTWMVSFEAAVSLAVVCPRQCHHFDRLWTDAGQCWLALLVLSSLLVQLPLLLLLQFVVASVMECCEKWQLRVLGWQRL